MALTVREAFEKAGHPVHFYDEIYCTPGDHNWMPLWWTDFAGLGQTVSVFDELGLRIKWIPLAEVDPGLLEFFEARSSTYAYNIANLPARDALEALPQEVRKVVEDE